MPFSSTHLYLNYHQDGQIYESIQEIDIYPTIFILFCKFSISKVVKSRKSDLRGKFLWSFSRQAALFSRFTQHHRNDLISFWQIVYNEMQRYVS